MAQDYTPAVVPTSGQIVSVVLQMSTFGVLCICFSRRTSWIKNWRSLPLTVWLILIIYVDSTLFVLAKSIIVHGLGINSSRSVCEGGILLCLVCYMTTKILIYYFLVERAYIVRGSLKPRLKTKLWLFNCLFMILPYTAFVIMNFIWRITYINDEGVCIIGMQQIAMLPLIIFEVVVNIYLTLLFVLPLRQLYSYKNNINPKLNRIALRSLIGSLATLTTSVANLTVLMVLHGEPGWICLTCCNADILFCVIVLHWVTSKDKPLAYPSTHASRNKTPDILEQTQTPGLSAQRSVALEKQDAAQCDIIVQQDVHSAGQTADPKFWPYDAPPSSPVSPKMPGTVTTEIFSGQAAFAHSKSQSRGSECGDDVGLHIIYVHREVCIDSRSYASEAGSSCEHDLQTPSIEDAWWTKRSNSAETMV